MSLVTRDPATGLRRGPIRFPNGRPPTPFGCRWCGTEQGGHGRRWAASARVHQWARPTDAQILTRMKDRIRARREAAPTQYHATTHWDVDQTGEAADPYCADCGTTCCPRWNRIYDRLQLRRQGLRRWPRTSGTRGGWGGDARPNDEPF